ncbi:hypothetical protein J2766_003395 [Agrobacterium tumefaciens]|uniref:Tail fiber protein n=1 Tax=Agrobacterium tumefaciens TaxID=358 RepID=A0AAW8LPY0_AGRTU|nr:hypothetical protein [Agrobacterium tumefaciens]MBP2566798.1 hypothetical protein [Agrobacterium tumefaciens]MDR6700743.1 hypothetical protein [Agrobacterium tumefaciens]
MPFDSNGNYTLPTSYFVENGDTVLPIQHNPPFEDVAQALSATLLRDGRSPMTGDLKMGTKKITFLGDGTANTDAITKQQLDSAVSDPWAMQPVGALVWLDDGTVGFSTPPKDKSYRYVELTAGLTGAGAYNEGILVSETVSGSSPVITATAVVSLAGSPFDGRTIILINTSREFLRPGSPGSGEMSQNLSHSHNVNDPGHSHALNINPLKGWYNGSNQDAGPGSAGSNHAVGMSSNVTGIWLSADGGNEARPRNRGVRLYRRIK